MRKLLISFFAMISIGHAASAPQQNVTIAGYLWVEPSTLISAGFEWRITGDENRNASVVVSFRKKDDKIWRAALPLVRSQHEFVGSTEPPRPDFHPDPFHYPAPNMFAGSIFNLETGTEYEARLVLSDPDGAKGKTTRIVRFKTRKEPVPAVGGHVYHVYPIGWTGPKQQPAFTGLMEAYYQGAASSDYEGTYPPRVVAGDTILVHAGTYMSDRVRYQNGLPHPGYNALSTLFDGTYYLTASGTEERPIAIKAAGDGEVIFDGNGAQTFFNLEAANYNYFEGLTFRNANLVFLLGQKNIAGSSGFTLKNSRLYDIGRGIQDDWSGSKNITILDSSFIGRHDPLHVVGWIGSWLKRPGGYEELGGPNGSEYGVKIYGQGHAVAYNYFANWHDGLDIATYGNPDGTPNEMRDRVPVSIDFYNNDFDNMGDNCIESDGGAHNIRVFRNRCFNSTGGALSATPLVGGPVYFFQNLVYNTTTGGITKYNSAAGIITWQNTFIGDVRGNAPSMYFLNNLILSDRNAPLFAVTTQTNYSSSDFNGFFPNSTAKHAFEWNSPPFGTPIGPDSSIEKRSFATLADYTAATGQDRHSRILDYDVFVKASAPDIKNMEQIYAPEDFDFTLKPGSAAIDAAAILPTINDNFTGSAPDLGAYELGKPTPNYGPRQTVPGKPMGDGSIRTLVGPPAGH